MPREDTVPPEARGQWEYEPSQMISWLYLGRRWYDKGLMNAVFAALPETGTKGVHPCVASANTASRAFYELLAFRTVSIDGAPRTSSAWAAPQTPLPAVGGRQDLSFE